MAQGVRPRQPLTAAPAGRGLGSSARARAGLALGSLAGLLAVACGDATPPAAAPRAVDLAAIADADLVDAVLDECHRPLRGRLDRIAAVVTLPDGAEVHLFAQLPDQLRTQAQDGSYLLRDDTVLRLGDDGATAATADDAERVRRLRALLDGALLGPLHRAVACTRAGACEWDVTERGGGVVRLALQPGTLLPARLGDVTFGEHLRTTTTWVAKRSALPGLGDCTLRFTFGDVTWAPDFFTAKPRADAQPTPLPAHVRMTTQPGEARSPVPVLQEQPATAWLVIADPADWPARHAAYRPLHAALEAQDQHVAGFPLLWREGERSWLGAPFRRRADGPAFVVPHGFTVRELPAGRWLVVYPPAGDLTTRLADGERLLRETLAARGLEAAGPIVAQPFVHLQEGVPTDDKLAAPVVRLSVPVR